VANNEIFNHLAENYDTEGRKEIATHTAYTIREYLIQQGIQGGSMIDYGCGTGLVGLELADLFEEVTFIDASPKMVEAVKEKISAKNVSNARALCADAALELNKNVKGDVLILTQVLLHEPDTRALMEKLCEATNPNGHIIIVDFERNDAVDSDRVHAGFELMQLQADLLYAGFEPIHSHLFLHAEKYFMGQDASLFILVGKKV